MGDTDYADAISDRSQSQTDSRTVDAAEPAVDAEAPADQSIDGALVDATDATVDTIAGDAAPPACSHTTSPIDTTDQAGWSASLLMAPSGVLHVAFETGSNGAVRHGTKLQPSAPWVISTVDTTGTASAPNQFAAVSLALDSTGNDHLAYVDVLSKKLRYAHNKSGGWTFEDVTASGAASGSVALGLDSADSPKIAFMDTGYPSSLWFAERSSGVWVTEIVDEALPLPSKPGLISNVALGIDSADQVHLVYGFVLATSTISFADLRHAILGQGGWNIDVLLDGQAQSRRAGFATSVVVDDDDNLHVVHYDALGKNLEYLTNQSGVWKVETIVASLAATSHTSLFVNNGKAHVTYFDPSPYDLVYATNKSGQWRTYTIGEASASNVPLVIDATGAAHVVYMDAFPKRCMYAVVTCP